MTATADLDGLRVRGIRLLALWLAAWTIGLALLGSLPGFRLALWALPIAIANCTLPAILAVAGRHDTPARIVMGIATAINPGLYVFAFQGHEWQMDMHLFYMVNLAGLAVLCDWRPLAAAAAVMVANHLLGDMFVPGWVFEGEGDFPRVLLHGGVVLTEFALLAWLCRLLNRLIAAQHNARIESDRLAGEAVAARHVSEIACAEAVGLQQRAERALVRAETAEADARHERAFREAAEQAARTHREAELRALATTFEGSVAAAMRSVEEAARRLATSAEELNDLAHHSDHQASAVVGAADRTFAAARIVAEGVTNLSGAMASILSNVTEQADRSAAAQTVSRKGAEAVRALAGSATRIGEFAGAIGGIARTTNLVAINAAIEAARHAEAGRGFAVVAGEVKALAGHATIATGQITELTAEIHSSAIATEHSLQDIDDTLSHVVGAASSIRQAVQAQREGTVAIEHGAESVAAHTGELARSIGRAADAADATRSVSDSVQVAANGLLETAQALRTVTVDFVERLRAA